MFLCGSQPSNTYWVLIWLSNCKHMLCSYVSLILRTQEVFDFFDGARSLTLAVLHCLFMFLASKFRTLSVLLLWFTLCHDMQGYFALFLTWRRHSVCFNHVLASILGEHLRFLFLVHFLISFLANKYAVFDCIFLFFGEPMPCAFNILFEVHTMRSHALLFRLFFNLANKCSVFPLFFWCPYSENTSGVLFLVPFLTSILGNRCELFD